MQEQKEFSTALFGFDKKAVLAYIYEQDKQARNALEELARRNASLEDNEKQLNEKMGALDARCRELSEQVDTQQQAAKEAGNNCDILRERVEKISTQLHEKENSLQLQMEINKKMQQKISEQQSQIEKLQSELSATRDTLQMFRGKQQDYAELRERLDRFKNEFSRRIESFEQEFSRLEASIPAFAVPSVESVAEEMPKVTRVSPRIRADDEKRPMLSSVTASGNSVLAGKNRLKKIFDEWK